jgi:hypothetical protein
MPGQSAKRVFAQMTRASTAYFSLDKKAVDGRVKPGHDEESPFFRRRWKERHVSNFTS